MISDETIEKGNNIAAPIEIVNENVHTHKLKLIELNYFKKRIKHKFNITFRQWDTMIYF